MTDSIRHQLSALRSRVLSNEQRPSAEEIAADLSSIEAMLVAQDVARELIEDHRLMAPLAPAVPLAVPPDPDLPDILDEGDPVPDPLPTLRKPPSRKRRREL